MASPIFVDANVPFYATGQAHALKQPCADIIVLIAQQPSTFVTDAEVLQELVHRYVAINAWSRGRMAFHEFANVMRGRVEAMLAEDVENAAQLADEYTNLSARDLIHIAVMNRIAVDHIVSADRGFDRVPQIRRLDPADFPSWRHELDL